MNQELLDRLQKADPGLWEKIAETALSEYEYHDEEFNEWISNAITYADLFGPPAQEAWLQHCLQEAIQAHGLGRTQIAHAKFELGSRFVCQLRNSKAEGFYGHGDTEAEALLRAYLAAIKH